MAGLAGDDRGGGEIQCQGIVILREVAGSPSASVLFSKDYSLCPPFGPGSGLFKALRAFVSDCASRRMTETKGPDVGDGVNYPDLNQLIRETPALWRGRQLSGQPARPGSHTVDTGFAGLNRLLPNGGWPLRAVIEINVAAWGNGELQLLLPLIARLTRGHSRVAMVAPPFQPYAPALVQGGVDLSWLVVVGCSGSRQNGASRQVDRDIWWSAEKLLRHPDCGLVLLWPPRPNPARTRRLQLAADAGDGIGVILHCGSPVDTPVGLRLRVARSVRGLEVSLDKSRYGWRQQSSVLLAECALENVPATGISCLRPGR